MTDAEVYRRAAEAVFKGYENDGNDYCCWAIEDQVGIGTWKARSLISRFGMIFKPQTINYGRAWWADKGDDPIGHRRDRPLRVTALLFMAEMVESGDA